MIEISPEKFAAYKAQMSEVMLDLINGNDTLAWNFAGVGLLLDQRLGNTKPSSDISTNIALMSKGDILETFTSYSNNPEWCITALTYTLSICAVEQGMGMIHPSVFTDTADKMYTHPEENAVLPLVDVIALEQEYIKGKWAHYRQNHNDICGLFDIPQEEKPKLSTIPETVDELMDHLIAAFKRLHDDAQDISFPVPPHLLHARGFLSNDNINLLISHEIVPLVLDKRSKVYDKIDAVFGVMLFNTYTKSAIERGAKTLSGWFSKYRKQYTENDGIFYQAELKSQK